MISRFYLWTIVLIAALGLILASQIKLSRLELAHVLNLDKKYNQSLAIYTKLWQENDRSLHVIIPLTQLYLQFGKVSEAIKTMEYYVKQHPDNVLAHKKLNTLYRSGYRPIAYLKGLEAYHRLKSKDNTARELSAIYNFYGLYDKQKKVLHGIIDDSKDAYEKDYYDLAYLYAKEEKYTEAAEVLKKLTEKYSSPSLKNIEFSISIFLDAKQPQKAYELANSYIKNDINKAIYLANKLQYMGAEKLAYDILKPFSKNIFNNDKLLLIWIEVNISLDNEHYAYLILNQLYNKNRLPKNTNEIFFQLVGKYGDELLQQKILVTLSLKDFDQQSLIDFATELVAQNKLSLLNIFKNKLPIYIIKDSPILNLLLSININDDDNLLKLIKESVNEDNFDQQNLIYISQLFIKLKKIKIAKFAMQQLNSKDLEEINIFEATNILLDLKLVDYGLKLLNSSNLSPSPQLSFAKNMLYAAINQESIVLTYASSLTNLSKNEKITTLKTLYYIAQDFNHYNLAYKLALSLYSSNQNNQEYLSMLTSSLISDKQFIEALPYIRSSLKQFNKPETQELYLFALTEAISKQNLSINAHENYHQEINNIVTILLKNKKLSNTKRSQLADILLNIGNKQLAIKQYQMLAMNKLPKDNEIKQLIYLWGPQINNEQLNWISKRALNDQEQPGVWLLLLNDLNFSEKTIELINKNPAHFHDKYSKLALLQALSNTQQQQLLAKLLLNTDFNIFSQSELKKLRDIIATVKNPSLNMKLDQKLLQIAPNNYKLQEKIANSYFEFGSYDKSAQIYAKLADENHLTITTNYNYAQLLTLTNKHQKAKKYYIDAITLLAKVNDPTKEELRIKADSFAQLNQFSKASSIYSKLLLRYPNDNSIKVSYANLLIDNNKLEEANKILKGMK